MYNPDDEDWNCDYRKISPDDGTKAGWFLNSSSLDDTWNFIIMDESIDFMTAYFSITDYLGVNGWDYILGEPIESEGSVSSWKSILS